MLLLAALPTAAEANDALNVVAAPKDFIGQKVSVSCEFAYAQEASPIWCEVFDSAGKEVGTIYVYLTNLPHQEDRLRAMKDCADQNPRKNNRDRCRVTLTGGVGVQRERAFLSDPTVEWASK
jgi:hypothetical protein